MLLFYRGIRAITFFLRGNGVVRSAWDECVRGTKVRSLTTRNDHDHPGPGHVISDLLLHAASGYDFIAEVYA